ncbi:hypothetical protein Dimus_014161 [Dionaea muscipula]
MSAPTENRHPGEKRDRDIPVTHSPRSSSYTIETAVDQSIRGLDQEQADPGVAVGTEGLEGNRPRKRGKEFLVVGLLEEYIPFICVPASPFMDMEVDFESRGEKRRGECSLGRALRRGVGSWVGSGSLGVEKVCVYDFEGKKRITHRFVFTVLLASFVPAEFCDVDLISYLGVSMREELMRLMMMISCWVVLLPDYPCYVLLFACITVGNECLGFTVHLWQHDVHVAYNIVESLYGVTVWEEA